MITLRELLSGRLINDIPISHQFNLEELLQKMNVIRLSYGKPMTITSGYRSQQDHLRIYSQRNIHPPHVPMGSQHLIGGACDILDRSGELMQWCRDNVPLLESTGLWIEDDPSQPRVHFQINPPRSGNRFFKP